MSLFLLTYLHLFSISPSSNSFTEANKTVAIVIKVRTNIRYFCLGWSNSNITKRFLKLQKSRIPPPLSGKILWGLIDLHWSFDMLVKLYKLAAKAYSCLQRIYFQVLFWKETSSTFYIFWKISRWGLISTALGKNNKYAVLFYWILLLRQASYDQYAYTS